MKSLKVGVIGLGMGSSHVNAFQLHPDAEVVAIADLNGSKLKEVSSKFNIAKCYEKGEELIEKESLDIVSIATPNKFHKPLTIAAFNRGAHVLCEKPMAMNASEACEMLEAAKKADRRLMINFSYRFNPQSWVMKHEVDAGLLGDIYFARTVWLRRRGMPGFGGWFGQKALSGGGPLIDLGVHRLDLALWLMGYPKPKWVMASSFNYIGTARAEKEGKRFDVEDMAVALIKFDNRVTLELEASWAGNIKQNELMETRLMGTKGGLLQNNVGEGYDGFDVEFFLEIDGCQYDLKPHKPVQGCSNAMTHFVDSIISGKPHDATGEQGLIVMQLLDAIYKSAETGKPVEIT